MKRSLGVFVATMMVVALVMTAVAGSVVSGKDREGCTPGYWKQPQHANSWVATGYAPGDYFDDAFGVSMFGTASLLDVLKMKGNEDAGRLGGHAVAALLNVASQEVNYRWSLTEVINALKAGNKGALEWANELGCPLN